MKLWTINDNRRPNSTEKGSILKYGRLYLSSDEHDATYATLSWCVGRRAGWGLSLGATIGSEEGCPLKLHLGLPLLDLHLGLLSDRHAGWAVRLASWWAGLSLGLDKREARFYLPDSHPGRAFSYAQRDYSVRVFGGKVWFAFHSDWGDSQYGWEGGFGLLPREMHGVQRMLRKALGLRAHTYEEVLRIEECVEVPLPEGPVRGTFIYERRGCRWEPVEWFQPGKRTYDRPVPLGPTERPSAPVRAFLGRMLTRVFERSARTGWQAEFEDPGLRHPGKGENSWDCDEDATSAMPFSPGIVGLHDAVGQAVASCLRSRYRYGGLHWRPETTTAKVSER